MTLACLLLASLFCSLSMSYENGMQLWKDCPSTQSTTGSNGSHFEITKKTFNGACTNLLPELDTENPSIADTDMQLTSNEDRVNITWNVQYENQCYRRIFMLDVEYRIRNSRGDGAYVDYYCFQYNLSKGEPEQTETVTFYLDCIRTVPDREAYLNNMTLWSLLPNSSASFRRRRSAKSQCDRIRFTRVLKTPLKIGPIPSNQKEEANRNWCQCWANSSISLKPTTDTKDGSFSIVVANPNPYAALIMVKMYKEKHFTSPVFSVSSRLISAEEVKVFLTNISCENGEGTYTPELLDQCYDSDYLINSECRPQYILGPSFVCRVKPTTPASIDTHQINFILPVSAGVIAAVLVTVIVFLYRRAERMNKPALTPAKNRHSSKPASEETETIYPEGNYLRPTEDSEEEEQTVPSSSKHIMLLNHMDFTTAPVRKDCVDLIKELLRSVGMNVHCLDRAQLFRNWIELAEKASKDDITEFLIIFSRELASFQYSYMRSFNKYDGVCTELHSDRESDYFSSAVLRILRDRYFLPGTTPFRIHILSLEHSDSQMCKQYIDTYSSFMITDCRSKNRQNTYLYCFAKCSEDTKSFIFDETVLPSLLKRLKGTTFPTNIYASKLKEKLSKLFGNKTSSTVGERTAIDNCVAEDRERKQYSLATNVQQRPLFSESEYIYRREKLPFVRPANSAGISNCSQSR